MSVASRLLRITNHQSRITTTAKGRPLARPAFCFPVRRSSFVARIRPQAASGKRPEGGLAEMPQRTAVRRPPSAVTAADGALHPSGQRTHRECRSHGRLLTNHQSRIPNPRRLLDLLLAQLAGEGAAVHAE